MFVDDTARGVVDIHTPSVRLPFAGYPLIGTDWLLSQHGTTTDVLRTQAGDVAVRHDGEFTWVRGRGSG